MKIKKNKISVITLGCSKNIYDSEVLMGQLSASNIEITNKDDANIIVINTCGFIGDAKEESIETILNFVNLKEKNKIDNIYVTGCLSERYKKDLEKEIKEVDRYFGTHDLPELLKTLGANYKKELIGERITTTPTHFAYLKISEGCDRTCSFCAIPIMRGKHVSVPIENLIIEAQNLAKKGVKELILIAQDLTHYGLDIYKERKLAELLNRLSNIPEIEWIRLHYAYPTGFPMNVIDEIKTNEKVCNYLDIPLQHSSTKILESMRRGTTKEKTTALINKIRKQIPNIAIRTTLIAGYPGETEADFEEMKAWVKEMRFDRLGVFAYSHEEDTQAFALEDNVPDNIKQKRVAEIMEIQSQISFELNQNKVGRIFKCIFDRVEDEYFIGRTEYDSPEVDNEVLVSKEDFYIPLGQMIDIKITSATEFDLFGKPLGKSKNNIN